MSTKGKAPFTVSRKEAAKKLKVSTRTLDRYIKSKKLSSKNIAGRIFLNVDELTKFAKKKRRHRNVRKKSSKNKTVATHEVPDVFIESDVDFVGKVENRIYKNLYDEVQRDLKGFQQRLEGANYRVGQLEAQLESSVPLREHQKLLVGHKKERYNKRIVYVLLAIVLGLQPLWLLLVYL
ncbi:helix-turn-helix domain-containing protein [Candidatus Peregrinibacteria bacterium]|nr:helix-turn-helix domain-containing protein [Candidatus Peregrinibacteria bacterium]